MVLRNALVFCTGLLAVMLSSGGSVVDGTMAAGIQYNPVRTSMIWRLSDNNAKKTYKLPRTTSANKHSNKNLPKTYQTPSSTAATAILKKYEFRDTIRRYHQIQIKTQQYKSDKNNKIDKDYKDKTDKWLARLKKVKALAKLAKAVAEAVGDATSNSTDSNRKRALATLSDDNVDDDEEDDGIEACTDQDLAIVSSTQADVKRCTKASSYDFMSGDVPTATQQTKLCSADCATLLKRLLVTPIPYCYVAFDGETVDFLPALHEIFWDCTEIPVEAASVDEEELPSTPAGSGPTDTNEQTATLVPTASPTVAGTADFEETTTAPVTIAPATSTSSGPTSTPTPTPTPTPISAACASWMSMQAVTLVMTAVVAVLVV